MDPNLSVREQIKARIGHAKQAGPFVDLSKLTDNVLDDLSCHRIESRAIVARIVLDECISAGLAIRMRENQCGGSSSRQDGEA